MRPILELNNVSKTYSDFKLDNISLSLPSGVIMGFIGENGAGKSTTIKLILDLIAKESGDIKVFGQDNQALSKEMKEKIGVVLDESCFPEGLSLKDIGKVMSGIYKTWNQRVFDEYVKKFRLPSGKQVKDYSRGMKMKLSIAVALSHNPQLLILDEATGGLDPIIRDEILDVFLEFIQDESHSIFISSHIISDLEKICDYIAFIHGGKLILQDTKDALLDRYGVLKCSEKEYQTIDKKYVVGCRKNTFGVEALVHRTKMPKGLIIDPASIEEIMLFHVKESVR